MLRKKTIGQGQSTGLAWKDSVRPTWGTETKRSLQGAQIAKAHADHSYMSMELTPERISGDRHRQLLAHSKKSMT